MVELSRRLPTRIGAAITLAGICLLAFPPASMGAALKCVEVISSGSLNCTDPGGVPSTCSKVACPAAMTLTGAGGACAAGDRRIKALVPRVDEGSVTLMCEQQGVDPQAIAVCCQLQ
jgi:hypothetical protein